MAEIPWKSEEMCCKYLLVGDSSELTINFSSSSVNDPGDDPVSELEVSDWDVRRARVGEGDDLRSSLYAFLLSLPVVPLAGTDFLRFFEFRLPVINTFRLLEDCLFLGEVQLNGEQVIFSSVASSEADEYCGLLDADGVEWRKIGSVSDDEVRIFPLKEVAIMKYMLHINQTLLLQSLIV